jgi:hypothetical protein
VVEEAIREAWHAVLQQLIDALIDSMPSQIKAVKTAKGWYTK